MFQLTHGEDRVNNNNNNNSNNNNNVFISHDGILILFCQFF